MPHALIPIILSGGVGSRLWPLSRELRPKPFIRMRDGQSLLQKAFIRGAQLPDVSEILTVTNRELLFQTKDEYLEVNSSRLPTTFLLEPFGRNTAAAIAAAVLHYSATQPDAILLVLPADHLITNQLAFAVAVQEARRLAAEAMLVTFGITPNAPETGYGYLEADGHRVLRFVEKPDAITAANYIKTEKFFWNSGMFCFRVSTMLAEMREHCPGILDTVNACFDQSFYAKQDNSSQHELSAKLFEAVPENSIDYAVMEKSNRVGVVQCDIGWSDVGSWAALAAVTPTDAQGNQVEADAILHDVSNCFIRGERRLVSAVGVRDLVIVDTEDALLVASRERSQEVKRIYEQLKASGGPEHKSHSTVHRPWGHFTVLAEGENYKVKRIVVNPGARVSLQKHYHRNEYWVITQGTAMVTNGDQETLLTANQYAFIPRAETHRLENRGLNQIVLIEIQYGECLDEDDIVRLEDDYGR
jgi:mannose-1-phosphate guanylyltransferase/mannose-6-phosphate isomerase